MSESKGETNKLGAVIRPKDGWKAASEKDFQQLIAECDQTEGWTPIKEQKEADGVINSWCSSVSGNANLKVKIYSDIFRKIPVETLVDVILDPDYRKTWDTSCIECSTVEKIDEWNEINYYSAKVPSPISNRDWCNKCASTGFTTKDGMKEYVTFNKSVVDPACPEKPGFVRAHSFLTGYVMRQVVNEDGSQGSTITYFTHSVNKNLFALCFSLSLTYKKFLITFIIYLFIGIQWVDSNVDC